MFTHIVKRIWQSRRGIEWALLAAAIGYAAWVRSLYVFQQDFPTGDEVNAYIFFAQQFLAGGDMPGLADFPVAVLVYAGLIHLLSLFDVPLAGVEASRWCAVLAGMGSTVFLWLSLRALFSSRIASVGAVAWLIFPGTVFVLRGDLSLYALWLTALQYILLRMVRDPRWRWAVAAGLCAGLFYMTRSDGLYVSLLTFLMFALFRQCRIRLVVSVLVMGLTVAGYLGLRVVVVGDAGTMPSDRALAAFHQAEGLHDGKGGTWHDYEVRGREKYAKYADEGDGLLTLLVRARAEVLQRVLHNAALVKAYMAETSTAPPWVLGLLLAFGFTGAIFRRALLVLVLPGAAVCALYLVFYYQRSYFVLLSYCLCFGLTVGFASLVRAFASRVTKPVIESPMCLVALLTMILTMHGVFTGAPVDTFYQRSSGALAFIEQECALDPGLRFYSRMYSGSRAINVYVNIPDCGVPEESVLSTGPQDTIQQFAQYQVSMVFATQEDPVLWNLWPDHVDLLYRNTHDDVRVYGIRPQSERDG